MAADLPEAIVAQLRAWNGGKLAAALGDSLSTPKIWADKALGSPSLPWVRVNTPVGTREYSSDFNYIERGQVQIDVFASGELAARQIGWLIGGNAGSTGAALDDAALAFDEGTLMFLRLRREFAVPTEGVGVAVPTDYHRALLFDFAFSGQD